MGMAWAPDCLGRGPSSPPSLPATHSTPHSAGPRTWDPALLSLFCNFYPILYFTLDLRMIQPVLLRSSVLLLCTVVFSSVKQMHGVRVHACLGMIRNEGHKELNTNLGPA